MTAEVAIMNKEAIALAADSAVTFQDETGQKIFTSASKIFTLSKYQPVGVMVYGNASFMGVPWETIIKTYRNDLGQKTYSTVGEYTQNLLSFLSENEYLFSDDVQEWYIESTIRSYFRLITDEITKKAEKIIDESGEIDQTSVKSITSQIIRDDFKKWKESELCLVIPDGFANRIRQKYRTLISKTKKEVFKNLLLTQHSSRQLTEIAINQLIKFRTDIVPLNSSGIVIAGFGTEDVFPVLESFSVEGKIDEFLKYKKDEERCAEISFQHNASIIPFAQSEMVHTFMQGVDPIYQREIDGDIAVICASYPQILLDAIDCLDKDEKETLKNTLKKIVPKKFSEYIEKLSNYRTSNYINPVMKVVQALPKDELAAMAETLINLTSFKRRVSMQDETVDGPIDVAIISKGDGFIWIKRKHYFDRELNQHFFANYYEETDNGTETTERTD